MPKVIRINPPELADYQREFLYCGADITVVEATTKGGKTFSHQWDAFEYAHSLTNGDQVWWIAPTYQQARIPFDDLARMLEEVKEYRVNHGDLTITLPAGGVLRFKSGEKPSFLYGPSNVRRVYVDEFTRCRRELWDVCVSLTTPTNGSIKMIGNYTGEDSSWHLWIKSMLGVPGFRYFRVTAPQAVRAGIMSSAAFERARATLHPSVFAALYLCEGSFDPDMLVEYSAIADLWTNEKIKGGRKYITADVARYGRDRTVIGLWNGWRLVHLLRIDKGPMDIVVAAIRQLATQEEVPMSRVMVDDDGVGGGVVDYLRCIPYNGGAPADEVDGRKELYVNLRTQNLYGLAQAVNDRAILIETQADREEIERELVLIRKAKPDPKGRLRVMDKEEVKERLGRSPDYTDMMAQRLRFDGFPEGDVVDSVRATLEKRDEARARALVQSTNVRSRPRGPHTFGGR